MRPTDTARDVERLLAENRRLADRIRQLEADATHQAVGMLRATLVETLRAFAKGMQEATGEATFQLLASALAKAIGVDMVLIGERVEPLRIRSLAWVVDGAAQEPIAYDLPGTPCYQVVHRAVCVYPDDVRVRFPEDEVLVTLGVVGYMGLPLLDAGGEVIGLVSILDRKPLHDMPYTESMLQIVARAAEAELLRQRAEAETRRQARELAAANRRLRRYGERMEAEVQARTLDLARAQEARIRHLEELDRLKGDFINAASHELRTPLTSIKGYAEFMEDGIGGPLTDTQVGFVAQIQASALRLQRIVDDMLDFARLEAGTFKLIPEDFDLGERVRSEVESVQPQAREAALELSVEVPPGPVMVRLDAGRIGQVLLNLLSNAIKFTPPGGRIQVRLLPCDGQVRLEVRDSGIGIAPTDRERLFEKFYQVDATSTRERGGAGLGLAISRALVEAQGGSIGLESAVGQGSVFWLTLPIAQS